MRTILAAHAETGETKRPRGFAFLSHGHEISGFGPHRSASGAEQRAFERRMQRCTEVIQCAEIAGEVDYLLTVVARDMPSFGEFTRAHLADVDCRAAGGRLRCMAQGGIP